MSRQDDRAERLLASYREATRLRPEQRARVLQNLQARMQAGDTPLPQLHLPAPELAAPASVLHGAGWKRFARIARLFVGLALVVWVGMDASSSLPDVPAAGSGDAQTGAPAAQGGKTSQPVPAQGSELPHGTAPAAASSTDADARGSGPAPDRASAADARPERAAELRSRQRVSVLPLRAAEQRARQTGTRQPLARPEATPRDPSLATGESRSADALAAVDRSGPPPDENALGALSGHTGVDGARPERAGKSPLLAANRAPVDTRARGLSESTDATPARDGATGMPLGAAGDAELDPIASLLSESGDSGEQGSREESAARGERRAADARARERSERLAGGSAAVARAEPRPGRGAAADSRAPERSERLGGDAAVARAAADSRAPEQRGLRLVAAELERETELMEQAQAALRRGDAPRALALLAEHTWRFPKGHLSEARDVARIDALCKAGHVEQARSRARQFLASRASSPFAARVRASCPDAQRGTQSP